MKLEEKLASLALIPEVREICQVERLARLGKTKYSDEMELVMLIRHFNAVLVRGDHLVWKKYGVPCPSKYVDAITSVYIQAGWDLETRISENSKHYSRIFFATEE